MRGHFHCRLFAVRQGQVQQGQNVPSHVRSRRERELHARTRQQVRHQLWPRSRLHARLLQQLSRHSLLRAAICSKWDFCFYFCWWFIFLYILFIIIIILQGFYNYVELIKFAAFVTSALSIAGSLYLAYILYVVLRDVCIVCNLSYLVNALIFYYNWSVFFG